MTNIQDKRLHIRAAHIQQDLHHLVELTQQLGYTISIKAFQHRLELIHQDPKYSTFIAEYDGKIVGYVGLIEQFTWQYDESILVIQAFVIDENHRGLGLGKHFLHAVEQIARAKNISTIKLNSGNRPERFDAHEFYKKQGYFVDSLGFKKVLDV